MRHARHGRDGQLAEHAEHEVLQQGVLVDLHLRCAYVSCFLYGMFYAFCMLCSIVCA